MEYPEWLHAARSVPVMSGSCKVKPSFARQVHPNHYNCPIATVKADITAFNNLNNYLNRKKDTYMTEENVSGARGVPAFAGGMQ
jgi:hypothetical protein